MAQENRFDPARLERIERRLQLLEDAEAIRNLKARYAALCDNHYDADGEAPGVVVVPVPIRAEFSFASDRARVR
jgi:hypothetical protein